MTVGAQAYEIGIALIDRCELLRPSGHAYLPHLLVLNADRASDLDAG